LGLVDRPIGETRAAHYTWQHLQQLLAIRKLTEQGFSLERVREVLAQGDTPAAASAPRAGSITVHSHIHLADGVELIVEPGQAKLTPEQLRRFAREAIAAFARIARQQDKETNMPGKRTRAQARATVSTPQAAAVAQDPPQSCARQTVTPFRCRASRPRPTRRIDLSNSPSNSVTETTQTGTSKPFFTFRCRCAQCS